MASPVEQLPSMPSAAKFIVPVKNLNSNMEHRTVINRSALLLLAALVICSGQVNAATEISPGVLYQPGTRLQVSSLGLELSVPNNWQALLPQGSEALVLEPIGQTARLIVTAVPDSSAQSIRQLMGQAQALDAMTQLVPGGQLGESNGIFTQQFEVSGHNPQNLKASAYGRLGSNQVALFVLMLEPAGQNLLPALGKQFIQEATFSAPQVAKQAQGSNSGPINWDRELRGRTLQYLKTSSGLSVDKRMNLCSDGSFIYTDNDSYLSSDAVSDFSASSQSSNAGRWEITGDRIKLTWNDGTRSQFTLSRRYVAEWGEWGTFVDDERWFNNRNRVCN